jgi:hypothetical protein
MFTNVSFYMNNTNKIPTTVKLDPALYDDLKILRVRHKFTLQSFVEKCIYLYVHDDTFKGKVNEFNLPELSTTGSL